MDIIALETFANVYDELETKAIEIIDVYNTGWTLDSIGVEIYDNRTMFNITMSKQWSGCDTDYDSLSFEMHELTNDITYFKNKRQAQIDKVEREIKLRKQKERKEAIQRKEEADKKEYKRLKAKFS